MKSWADCSSDEEDYSSDDAAEEEEEQETLEPTALEKLQINNDGENPLNNNSGGPGIREYDYPNQAPFNAFVGNLSYEISEVSHLQQALVDVVHDRLKEKINIIGAKICYERNSDNRNHRGFGYVELETLEEVSELFVCVCVCATKRNHNKIFCLHSHSLRYIIIYRNYLCKCREREREKLRFICITSLSYMKVSKVYS